MPGASSVPTIAGVVLLAGVLAPAALGQTRIADLPQGGVTIVGEVTAVFGNRFVLDDGSGQVLVETGPEWYRDIQVRQGERLTVTGEPERGHFEAFALRRQDGSIVEVQPAEGPPPWAGGPRGRHEARGWD